MSAMKKIVMGLLCLAAGAAVAVELLPSGGDDAPTVQAALDAADEGGEVTLLPGDYVFNSGVTLNRNVALRGVHCDLVSIRADGLYISHVHRGGGKLERPDNTLETFKWCWENGSALECDCRRTKDGVGIMLHDDRLKRTARGISLELATNSVSRTLKWNEIKDVDVGSYLDPKFAHHRIPTIEQTFAAMKGHPTYLCFVDEKGAGPEYIAAKAVAAGVQDQVYYTGPSYKNIVKWNATLPGGKSLLWIGAFPRSRDADSRRRVREHFEKVMSEVRQANFKYITAVSIHTYYDPSDKVDPFILGTDYLKSLIDEFHAHGVKVCSIPFAGGDREEVYYKLWDLGCDGFSTDYPSVMFKVIKALKERAGGVRETLAIDSFDWKTGKATVTNVTADCEFGRPICTWRLTIDEDVWSEGSLDLYSLSPRAARQVQIPYRSLPPKFSPVGYGRKRLTLSVADKGRVCDRRTFEMPGKPQLFPETPVRFRFTGDILTKPYLQNAGATGFTVCLETRRELPDLRLAWTADGAERKTPFVFRKADFSGTYLAKARIDGLKPGTKVAYEVAGEKGAFTTWREGADDFKCAIFGDFQSGISNGPKWWDWEEDPFLCGEKMFEDMVKCGCEFAVGTGDIADTADYRKELRPLLLERTCGVLGSKIPFFMAFGNHDSLHPASHFFLESPPSAPDLSSFAFFKNSCLFVCIDDAEIGNDKIPGSAKLRAWFEELMKSEAAQKAKFRFVFQHVPVYVEAFGNCNRWLADLFEKYGVDCVFSGDHHGYERIVRGKTLQVVNGCMGYFDHGKPDTKVLVNWYGDETKAGGHAGMPKPCTWRFQEPGKPGVLGPETPVYEGLLPGYATLEVKGDTATWTLIGFNADGSKIGPVDSFTMKAGKRPNAPKGIAMERYCYGQSPKGKWLLKYTLTGKGGRVVERCEDDEFGKSSPIVEGDVVGVVFTADDGRKRVCRLLPDNTLDQKTEEGK